MHLKAKTKNFEIVIVPDKFGCELQISKLGSKYVENITYDKSTTLHKIVKDAERITKEKLFD